MIAPDIAVIGHFSIDHLKLPKHPQPYTTLGGAVAYVSLATAILGGKASVLSKIGCDFPQEWLTQLSQKGIDISRITKARNEETTSFELTYNQDFSARILNLLKRGSPISLNDLPSSLNAKVIHIAPIADEIPMEVVEHLRHCSRCLSIDPQGMTRKFNENGEVVNSAQLDRRLLSLVDIYKSSLNEIQVLTGQSELKEAIKFMHDLGPQMVIVTMGSKGSILSSQGSVLEVPSCKSIRVVDPTGAGDVFIGAFLTENIQHKEMLWCACIGSAAASMVVEGVGTSFTGDKAEIYRRARTIYEKEIKP